MDDVTYLSPTAAFDGRILDVLERITGTDQVRRDLDIALFDQGLLDSLGMVELILALSEELGIDISPAEIERDQWATPRRIIAYLEQRSPA
jgi:D-alanine--poly(phosphoribitol) ligase subunit 2